MKELIRDFVAGIVLGVNDAVVRLLGRKVEPRPWTQPHRWIHYELRTGAWVEDPVCLICEKTKSATKLREPCSGPPGWR